MVASAPAPTQKHPPTHCKLSNGKRPGRRRKRAKNAVKAMIFVRGRHYLMRKVQLNIKGANCTDSDSNRTVSVLGENYCDTEGLIIFHV